MLARPKLVFFVILAVCVGNVLFFTNTWLSHKDFRDNIIKNNEHSKNPLKAFADKQARLAEARAPSSATNRGDDFASNLYSALQDGLRQDEISDLLSIVDGIHAPHAETEAVKNVDTNSADSPQTSTSDAAADTAPLAAQKENMDAQSASSNAPIAGSSVASASSPSESGGVSSQASVAVSSGSASNSPVAAIRWAPKCEGLASSLPRPENGIEVKASDSSSPPLLPWPSGAVVVSAAHKWKWGVISDAVVGSNAGDEQSAVLNDAIVRLAIESAASACGKTGPTARIEMCVTTIDHDLQLSALGPLGEEFSMFVNAPSESEGVVIQIATKSVWGGLRALETLRQIVSNDSCGGVGVHVTDAPRFAHRGVLVDVARNYVPMDKLRSIISSMAQVKLNTIHLHLTDDFAFAFASEAVPEMKNAGGPGGQYSVADLKSIVEFALQRGVRVVPELDMPGHAASWRRAIPQIVADCPNYVRDTDDWGTPLDVSWSGTLPIVEKLVMEVASIFPDKIMHVGGDEVAQRCWDEAPAVQEFMRTQGHESFHHTEAYFVNAALTFVQKAGKTATVWQEVFDQFIVKPPIETMHQTWISKFAFTEHLQKGYTGILSWGWYLNPGAAQGCQHWSGCYDIEPFRDPPNFKTMSEDDHKRVIGGEMALWELPMDTLDTALWPRGAAIAERLWSPMSLTDQSALRWRLAIQMDRFVAAGYPASITNLN